MNRRVVPLVAVVATLLAIVLCFQLAMRQYAGYDASFVVNLVHRLYVGQWAGLDFFSPAPPFYSLVALLGFKAWGSSWFAFAAAGAIVYSLAALCLFMMLRERLGDALAALLSLVALAQSGVFVAFWWHGSATTLFGLLFIAALVSPLARRGEIVVFVLLTAVLGGLKPNMAAPLLAGGYLWLVLPLRWGGAGRARFAIGCGAAALVLFAVYAMAAHTNPLTYVQDLRAISGRGLKFAALEDGFAWSRPLRIASGISIACLLAPLLVLLTTTASLKPEARLVLPALTAVFAGLLGAGTNGDYPLTSLPLCALGLLLLLSGPLRVTPAAMAALAVCWLLATAHAIVLGVDRDRVWAAGAGTFWEPPETLTRFDSGFFRGLEGGPELHGFITEAGDAIGRAKPKNVFFGPRVEFGWAEFDLVPPQRIPLWFDPGAAWPRGGDDAMVQDWLSQRFEMIVLLHNDATYMPRRMTAEVSAQYVPVYEFTGYRYATVWVRRDLFDPAVWQPRAAATATAR